MYQNNTFCNHHENYQAMIRSKTIWWIDDAISSLASQESDPNMQGNRNVSEVDINSQLKKVTHALRLLRKTELEESQTE